MQTFYSHGKLLITGEYVILDGAMGLALPTQKGQSLMVENIDTSNVSWKSLDDNGYIWFEEVFELGQIDIDGQIISGNKNDIRSILLNILRVARQLNPRFLSQGNGYKVISTLEFPRDWGLGSSSTLINNIANWAKVDAFELLNRTFRGSGYDIACAQNNKPLTYQLKTLFDNAEDHLRSIKNVEFNPKFSDALYFIHLNKKQDSREGIARYKSNNKTNQSVINAISDITKDILTCTSLKDFESLLDQHEQIISKCIDHRTIKEIHFKDFDGSIKSLGAWGGDFILVTAEENPTAYFKKRKFGTIIPFDKMVLK